MKEKIVNFLRSPSLALILFITAMLAVLWAYGSGRKNEHPGGNTQQKFASELTVTTSSATTTTKTHTTTSTATTTKKSTTTSTTTTTTTTSATTSTTTTTTVTTTEPPADVYESGQVLSPYLYAGNSPNSSFYQERMAVAGDSIATGFNLYGYIPHEHNIAKESVGLWNYAGNIFPSGMGMIDTIAYMQPRLLYISMGMNDLPNCNPDGFAAAYYDLISQIMTVAPNTQIVAAGISPVADYVTYSTNDNIRNYNYALENMIYSIGSPQVYYFDAYSVLADGNTLALSSYYSGGDGIHLASHSYNDILTALFNFLDTTPVLEQIMYTEQ